MSSKIEILFNGITLSFEEYTPLVFRNQTWKKDISFSFPYLDKVYTINGFVGIMEPGSFEKAGFALFRRNRVVVGGLGENYKPKEIFVQDQSQISLKLYGELDMDDFDINQAKDGFGWDSELEELFIGNLKLAIKDYISVAKMSKADRKAEENPVNPEPPVDNPEPHVDNPEVPVDNPEDQPDSDDYQNCNILKYNDVQYNVFWQHIDNKYSLYEYYQQENKLVMNLNHDYNLLVKVGERVNVSKVVLAYILAEAKAKYNSTTDGYIPAAVIRNQMSKILKDIKSIN